MGMYNEIMVPCPQCGELSTFQTKSGSCTLRTFHISECPPQEFKGIQGDSNECACGYVIEIDPQEEQKSDFSHLVKGY